VLHIVEQTIYISIPFALSPAVASTYGTSDYRGFMQRKEDFPENLEAAKHIIPESGAKR
jgi:hypothetical protein